MPSEHEGADAYHGGHDWFLPSVPLTGHNDFSGQGDEAQSDDYIPHKSDGSYMLLTDLSTEHSQTQLSVPAHLSPGNLLQNRLIKIPYPICHKRTGINRCSHQNDFSISAICFSKSIEQHINCRHSFDSFTDPGSFIKNPGRGKYVRKALQKESDHDPEIDQKSQISPRFSP